MSSGANTTPLGNSQPSGDKISDWAGFNLPRGHPSDLSRVEPMQPVEQRTAAVSSGFGSTTKLLISPEDRMAEYQRFLKNQLPPEQGPPRPTLSSGANTTHLGNSQPSGDKISLGRPQPSRGQVSGWTRPQLGLPVVES